MKLKMRSYEAPDFWKIRAFLRDTFLLNGRVEKNWQAYRFEYWRWHGVANLEQGPMEEKVFLWETPDGELAAVLNAEGRGSTFIQMHPEFRSEELEDEMIGVAEERLWTISSRDGRQRLGVWAHEGDELREGILERRGFRVRPGATMHDRWMSLEDGVPEPALPEGYTVRPMGDGIELLDRCYVSGLAFHPDNPAQAHENREDVTWYRNIQKAPLYRLGLDIVAIAPDASVASFCTIWFDDITLTAACEPVATSPAHQKKGLARACIHEGLRRAKEMGATLGFVGSGEDPAHKCYAGAGLKDYLVSQMWIKELD